MWQYTSIHMITLEWNWIVFENFMASIVDLMVAYIHLLTPLLRHQ